MRRAPILGLTGLLLLASLGIVASCTGPSQTTPEGSYLNLAPEVQYTGRESCKSCHQDIYDTYVQTGMGQSLYRPDPQRSIEDFGPQAIVHDQFSGYTYKPFWRDNELIVLEFRTQGADTTYRREEKVDYIVGSGHQTRSYLIDRGGYFYEVPITWYVARQRWDLSPGYEQGHNSRFDRPIGEECMACHTGKIDHMPGTVNFYRQVSLGIDCEKCHGPGQAHVERMTKGEIVDVGEEIDYSIVNPAKLPVEQQFDVCMQCHLQGVNVLKDPNASVQDFRPGMSLSAVYDIFIEQHVGEADFGIASHAERLMESQCFIRSTGKLTCTTCHDPHKSIHTTDLQAYTKQCQSCHSSTAAQHPCTASLELRQTQSDNCVTCHMRKAGTSDIPHVTFTDHKIRVLTDTVTAPTGAIREFLRLISMTDSSPDPAIEGTAYLLYFERHDARPEILAQAAQHSQVLPLPQQARLAYFQGNYPLALQRTDQALSTDPQNTWLLFYKAELLELSNRPADALAIYKQIHTLNPYLTEAALKAGSLTLRTATDPQAALNQARALFQAGLAKKPTDQKLQANMGFVEMNSGNFPAAEKHLLQALSTHPDYLLALENMVILQAQMKRKAAGQFYLTQLLQFHPDYPQKQRLQALLN